MDRERKFTSKDYLALGLSLLLACCAWFIHNLSLSYSSLAQCSFVVKCELAGRANLSSTVSEAAARLEMNGYDLAVSRLAANRKPRTVEVSQEDVHYMQGDLYYMAKDDLAKYFHEFFGAEAKLEYFVTDTVFLHFPEMENRRVPVKLLHSISFKPQYMASGEMRVMPDSVYVYGKKGQLDAVEFVATELVDYSDVSSELYGEVSLKPIRDLRISASKVQFSLPVVRYVEQEFSIGVSAVNTPANVELQVMPATARIRMKSVFPGILNAESISVAVDYLEFEVGRSGKCIGRISGLPEEVLSYTVEPLVFDCIIKNDY